MSKRVVHVALTYLMTYTEDELSENFEIESNEDMKHAARIALLGENMNDWEPNDIEMEVEMI